MKAAQSALIRAIRTFLQAFLGIVIGTGIANANVSTLKAAGWAGIGAVLSLIQNSLEQATQATVPRG